MGGGRRSGGGSWWTDFISGFGLGPDAGKDRTVTGRQAEEDAKKRKAEADRRMREKLAAAKALNLSLINKEKGTVERNAGASRGKELAALAFSSKQQTSEIPLGGSSIFEQELGTAVDTSKGKKGLLGV